MKITWKRLLNMANKIRNAKNEPEAAKMLESFINKRIQKLNSEAHDDFMDYLGFKKIKPRKKK